MLKKEDEVMKFKGNPLEVNYLQGTQGEGGENKHTAKQK